VLLEVLLRGGGELEGDELEAALLEAGDDLADEAALDAVGPGVSQGRGIKAEAWRGRGEITMARKTPAPACVCRCAEGMGGAYSLDHDVGLLSGRHF
jgi:hypothetical protein